VMPTNTFQTYALTLIHCRKRTIVLKNNVSMSSRLDRLKHGEHFIQIYTRTDMGTHTLAAHAHIYDSAHTEER